jgi:hypothetical protein
MLGKNKVLPYLMGPNNWCQIEFSFFVVKPVRRKYIADEILGTEST